MLADMIIAEIGSTITKVHAIGDADSYPRLLGQAFEPTTVDSGNVMTGLENALARLARQCGGACAEAPVQLASSSAAGGLRMTAHGLTYEMTLRAAKEACLGAGAVLRHVTAGAIGEHDLRRIHQEDPRIILLAGGVDHGEAGTVLRNAEQLARLECRPPIVYAGNAAVAGEAAEILSAAGFQVYTAANVYPQVDQLNPEPVRALVRDIFARHIVTAPGMESVRDWSHGEILPTPGAVLIAAEILAKEIGPLVILDVGGATTDVHSVVDPVPEIAAIMTDPVPRVRRTVEGDLGVFRNARNVLDLLGDTGLAAPAAALPADQAAAQAVRRLASKAASVALERHAGEVRTIYTASGPRRIARGTDLTGVLWIIGTGGPLCRLESSNEILESLRRPADQQRLLPGLTARAATDRDYLLSACGTMGLHYPDTAKSLAMAAAGLR